MKISNTSHPASRRSFLLSSAMLVTGTIAGCALPTISLPEVTSPAGLEPVAPPPPNPTATSAIEKAAAAQPVLPPYTIAPIAGHETLVLNLTTQDLRLREFFQQREVRIAMSLAVDREPINEIIFDHRLTARQYSPSTTSPQYNDKLSNAYSTYAPEQANALLDNAGYGKMNVNGIRIWPDSNDEEISIIIEAPIEEDTSSEQAILQTAKYIAEIGIATSFKPVEQAVYQERCETNDINVSWLGHNRGIQVHAAAAVFTGTEIYHPWCSAWTLWRNSGGTDPNGEAPPEGHWIYTIWSLWEQIEREADTVQRDALFAQILDIWAEELPMIAYLGYADL